MAEVVLLTNKETAAIDKIDAALTLETSKLCEIYQGIRDELLLLIAFLKKLPFPAAKTAAAALEFLMKIADVLCPA